jgi:agmatinase
MSVSFLDLKPFPVKEAEAVILPIPYEATVTYGGGTRGGPEAILSASCQVELWDEEHNWDPSAAIRLATALPVLPEAAGPQAMLDKIRRIVQPWISQGKFIAALGGEHTITTALVQAAQTRYPDFSVVALDAHADLRDTYDGSKLSHACVMRRIYELGRPLTLLGTRAYSREEADLMWVAPRFKMFKAKELHSPEGWQAALEHLKAISGPVYLSIDLDALDPAIMPGVGTPEPGGLTYYQVLTLIETLSRRGPIIGLDLVELAPIPGQRVSEFTAARLLYKALGYIYQARKK